MRTVRILRQVGTLCGIPILADPQMPPDRIDMVEGHDLDRVVGRIVGIAPPSAPADRGA